MDRRIDERFRKPRRTKGTPLFAQRNYIAVALLAISGLCWYLIDLTPGATFIKSNQSKLLQDSEDTKLRKKQLQAILEKPGLERLYYKIRERNALKDEPKEENCSKHKSAISKYFIPKNTQRSPSNDSELVDEQRNHKQASVCNVLNDSVDDFQPPTTTDKQQNILKWQFLKTATTKSPSTRKKRRKSKKNIGTNGTQIIFKKCSSTNSDTLALSKSESDNNHGKESSCSDSSNNETFLNQIFNKPTCLEKYGFRSEKINLRTSNKKIKQSEVKMKSKNRFKFITPILNIRSKTERESIIISKISAVLSKQPPVIEKHASIFNINGKNLKAFLPKNNEFIFTAEHTNYYVSNLLIEKSSTKKCGYLLKNWTSIPGREELFPFENFSLNNEVNSQHSEPSVNDNNTESSNTRLLTFDCEQCNEEHYNEDISNTAKNFGYLSPDIFGSDTKPTDSTANKIEANGSNINLICENNEKEISDTEIVVNLTEDIQINSHHLKNFEKSHEPIENVTIECSNNNKLDGEKANKEIKEHNEVERETIKNIDENSYIEILDDTAAELCGENHISPKNSTSLQSNDNEPNLYEINQNETCSKRYLDNIQESESDLNVTDFVNKLLTQNKVDSYCQVNESLDVSIKEVHNEEIVPAFSHTSHSSTENSLIDVEELNDSCNHIITIQDEGLKENNNEEKEKHSVTCTTNSTMSSPFSNNIMVKTKNVTPMRNYNLMNTPAVVKELEKYGVKPMKRKRGVNLLKHIYESTHPLIESIQSSDNDNDDDSNKIIKKRKNDRNTKEINSLIKTQIENIDSDDLVFEREGNGNISCCRIPLQIVWHNFINSNDEVKEKVLLHEPIELESLHMMLKEQGFNFRIEDLHTFLNKKSVLVKIAKNPRKKKK